MATFCFGIGLVYFLGNRPAREPSADRAPEPPAYSLAQASSVEPLKPVDEVFQLDHDDGPGQGRHVAALSADGNLCVSTGITDESVRVWDMQTGRQIAVLYSPPPPPANRHRFPQSGDCVAISPDRRLVLVGFSFQEPKRNAVHLYDLQNQKLLYKFAIGTERGFNHLQQAFFLPDQKILLHTEWMGTTSSTSLGGDTRWEINQAVQLIDLNHPAKPAWKLGIERTMAVEPQGRWFIDGALKRYALPSRQPLPSLGEAVADRVAVSQDGNWVVTAEDEKTDITLWEVATGKGKAIQLPDAPTQLAFTANPDILVYAAEHDSQELRVNGEGRLHVFDLEHGKVLASLRRHRGPTGGSGGSTPTLQVFHIGGGRGPIVNSLSVMQGGPKMVSMGTDAKVHVWDLTPWVKDGGK